MRVNYEPGVCMYLTDPKRLRDWIDHKGMTYADLARYVGVSRQRIHQLANGVRPTCTPELAAKIEQVLLAAPCRRSPAEEPLFVPRQSKKFGAVSGTVGDS